MEIYGSKSKETAQSKELSESLAIYPHDLTLYSQPPSGTGQFFEIEKIIIERLKVLQIIKQATDKGLPLLSEDWKKCVQEALVADSLHDYVHLLFRPDINSSWDDVRRRRKDDLSHWLLKYGFCNDETSKYWLFQAEVAMFKLKFHHLSRTAINLFIKTNNFPYAPMTPQEKFRLRDKLVRGTKRLRSLSQVEAMDFYKVSFVSVSDLIARCAVYVKGGYAYVPDTDILSILETMYKEIFNRNVAVIRRILHESTDDRLANIIQTINGVSNYQNYAITTNSKEIPIELLDQYVRQSFPLCMRNIYDILKREHHLRYKGRQQLQLFLKSIGVNLQGALELFRKEFTKKMDMESFEKNYAYNIRHSYGQEGSRINYKPPSCLQLTNSVSGTQDCYGCGFRTSDYGALDRRLKECGIGTRGIMEILDYAKKGHAQLACGKYFQFTHNNTKAAINHPNQYFEESLKYYEKVNANTK